MNSFVSSTGVEIINKFSTTLPFFVFTADKSIITIPSHPDNTYNLHTNAFILHRKNDYIDRSACSMQK